MSKTLARAGALLAFMTVVLPAPADAAASCSGDPCASVMCTSKHASGAANGSEYSHAVATAGGTTARAVKTGGGSSEAAVDGGLPTEADAKAKKDWSLKEQTAQCSIKTSGQVGIDILDLIGQKIVIKDPLPPLSVGCIADGRVRATESFAGRLYVGEDGGLVLFDSASRQGLALASLAAQFDGTSLDAVAPVDIRGMAPTGAVVTLDFVDNAQVSSCSAKLYV